MTSSKGKENKYLSNFGGTGNAALLKYVGLVSLSLQTASLVLVMRHVRTRPGDMFMSSSAVVMSEVFKFTASLTAGFISEGNSFQRWSNHLYLNIVLQPMDCLKVAIPSILYTIQNNLLYLAVSNLDAATFQVTYQLKILTTALFSVFLLRKRLSRLQWVALLLLFVGVSVVQLQGEKGSASSTKQNPLLGLIAVSSATLTSGFAGVFLEKILKGTKQALWLRNVQVGFVGMVMGYITMWMNDGETLKNKGILHGYDAAVWSLVCLHSFGGLMVAVVMRYADNILKGFATSASIIISCIASVYLFDFHLTLQFSVGALLVMCSVYMYSKYVVTTTANPSVKPEQR